MKLHGARGFIIMATVIGGLSVGLQTPQASELKCDPASKIDEKTRFELIDKLSKTTTGKNLIDTFKAKYTTLDSLHIFWDHVSYSKIIYDNENAVNRSIASVSEKNQPVENVSATLEKQNIGKNYVCIHLTKKLPEIEHIADLAHEMTHAIRLDKKVLQGEVSSVEEFVQNRIASVGGEADAFATECEVKNEILGEWDSLCNPYAKNDDRMNQDKIVEALYTGELSASLTGETYPIMLSRQYTSHMQKKLKNVP